MGLWVGGGAVGEGVGLWVRGWGCGWGVQL